MLLGDGCFTVRLMVYGKSVGSLEGCLPTQREACLRKARELGADVVEEYLDKDTGTLVDKRPAMQRLLARVEEDRDIDFVIVHKLDRLARNRLDDAHMTVTLEAAGATLVSCAEGNRSDAKRSAAARHAGVGQRVLLPKPVR